MESEIQVMASAHRKRSCPIALNEKVERQISHVSGDMLGSNRQKVQPCWSSSQWMKMYEERFERLAGKNGNYLIMLYAVGSYLLE